MRLRFLVAPALLCLGLLSARPGHAAIILDPSFNCAVATGTVEQIICHNSNLAEADRDLNQTYEATAAEPGIDPKRLRRAEDAWLLTRNKCTTDACVAAAYATRKTQLLAIDAHPSSAATLPPPAATRLLPLPLPPMPANARIMGVALDITGGRIALTKAPPGWQLIIDNDPSGHTMVNAHAIVGAASINPATLAGLFLVAAAPAADSSGPALTGSITTMAAGVLTTRPLTGIALQSASP